jgi:hypothetical protein
MLSAEENKMRNWQESADSLAAFRGAGKVLIARQNRIRQTFLDLMLLMTCVQNLVTLATHRKEEE